MGIRARSLRQIKCFGIPVIPMVFRIGAVVIADFHSVHQIRIQTDERDICRLTERMRMNDCPAFFPYEFQILRQRERKQIRMILQPLPIQSVGQKIVSLKTGFPSEEYIQTDLFAPFCRMLVSEAEKTDAFLPGQIGGNPCVAVQEMIGDNNSPIPFRMVFLHHSSSGLGGAFARFRRMNMNIIQKHPDLLLLKAQVRRRCRSGSRT